MLYGLVQPITRSGRMFGSSLLILALSVRAGAQLPAIGIGGAGAELCAAIHPTQPDIWLLGQDVGGILKSYDAGEHWIHVNRGLAFPTATANPMGIQELMFSPADPSIVFASTWGGLFRSTDTGDSWTRVVPPIADLSAETFQFSCVGADPGGALVLAGTGDPFENSDPRGLYRSTDGGLNFGSIALTGIPAAAIFTRLVIDPTSPPEARHVYAATTMGLFRSTDGGATYAPVDGGFAHSNIRDLGLVITPGAKRFWLMLQTAGPNQPVVYRSDDGLAWTNATGNFKTVREGFTQTTTRLRVHPTDPDTAYVSMRFGYDIGGIHATTDGGATWSLLTDDFLDLGFNTLWGLLPYGFDVVGSRPEQLLVAVEAEPIASTDGGVTWTQVGTRENGDGTFTGRGLEVTYVYQMTPSATDAQRIYAAYEDTGLWRSDDGGASWLRIFWEVNVGGRLSDGAVEVHVHPSDGDEVYAVPGSWSNGMLEPGAGSWLMHSTDAGDTWTNLTLTIPAGGRGCAAANFAQPEAQRTILFAYYGGTIMRSTDGGASWTESSTGMTNEDKAKIYIIARDPDTPGRVYAGTNNSLSEFAGVGGLYRSDDDGATWSRLAGYAYEDIYAIEFLGMPRRLFVGGQTYNGNEDAFRGALSVSDDGGMSFRDVLDQPFVYTATAVPGGACELIAGAGSHYARGEGQFAGLYRSTDNGESWERMPIELPHTGILDLMIPFFDRDRIYVATRGDGIVRFPITGANVAREWASY